MLSRWAQQPAAVGEVQAALNVALPAHPSWYIHMSTVEKRLGDSPQLPLAVAPAGSGGSVLPATPACASASSADERPDIGGRPRSTRSRLVRTKTCSGAVSAAKLVGR